jgi:hypothetical protein
LTWSEKVARAVSRVKELPWAKYAKAAGRVITVVVVIGKIATVVAGGPAGLVIGSVVVPPKVWYALQLAELANQLGRSAKDLLIGFSEAPEKTPIVEQSEKSVPNRPMKPMKMLVLKKKLPSDSPRQVPPPQKG